MAWDPAIHSKSKLGMAMHCLLVPTMPTEAQVSKYGQIHLRLGGLAYLTALPHALAPISQGLKLKAAMKDLPKEGSYSNSGAEYYKCTVKPSADGRTFELMAGDVRFCMGLVDSSAEIVSSDEKPEDQMDDADDDADLN